MLFLLLLVFCSIFVSKEECWVDNDQHSISCECVSSEEYFYEILKALYLLDGSTGIKNISIIDSSFQHVREFKNPVDNEIFYGKVDILEIKSSNIETIAPYSFASFGDLVVLDLSHNKLKGISFVFALNFTKNLILRYNQIDIDNLDVNDFNKSSLVDFSHNKIKSLNVTCHKGGKKYAPFLNLAFNEIKNFSFNYESECLYRGINLAGNENLHLVSNPNQSYIITPDNSNSAKKIKKGFKVFNISNNKIIYLNRNFGYFIRNLADTVDLTYCSLRSIDESIFKGLKLHRVLLANNNFKSLTLSVFDSAKIDILDISSSGIQNISKLFEGLSSKTLILRNNSIQQLSPQDFDGVKSVEELDLSFNNLEHLNNGSFSNCKTLKMLNVSNNKLASIDALNLPKLEVLDLGSNRIPNLKDGVFIRNLTSLKYLNLEKNLMSSIKSGVFENLSIVELNLGEGTFLEISHHAFHNLSRLKKLYPLSVENLRSNAFFHLQNLEHLALKLVGFSKNQIINASNYINIKSKTFSDLNNLETLTIFNSSIIIENNAFFGMFKLKYLDFPSTDILKVNKHSFRGLLNLRYLDFKSLFKNVKTIDLGILDDLNSMGNLDLGNLSISKIEPYAFQGLTSLKIMNLNHNNLGILVDKLFSGLNKLEILNISFSNVTDIENFSFYGLGRLQVLDLQGNNLKNLSDLKFSMNDLEYMNFESCRISKLSKNVFKHLTNLKALNLKNNLIDQVEDLQVDSFAHTPNLVELNLAGNFIDDFKVGAFSNLENLRNLDISNNNVTKFIIETFIPLKSLENLYLDNNHLKTLNILQFLPYSRNLKYVGISQNKLPCDKLGIIIKELRNRTISFKPHTPFYEGDNIEGIECVDVCKFLFCLKDTHGIN